MLNLLRRVPVPVAAASVATVGSACALGGDAQPPAHCAGLGGLFSSKPKSCKLTYFNIEGVVEPVRLALKLGGVSFEDKRIQFGEWAALKPLTPSGTLPYIEIDGTVVGQSDAMLRWAGQVGSPRLYPKAPMAALAVDEIIGIVGDIAAAVAPSVMVGMGRGDAASLSADEKKAKVKAMREELAKPENLPRLLGVLEARLAATGTGYFVGGAPTVADCAVLGRITRRFTNGSLDYFPTKLIAESFPLLAAHKARMEALPAVAAHYAEK